MESKPDKPKRDEAFRRQLKQDVLRLQKEASDYLDECENARKIKPDPRTDATKHEPPL